MRWQVQEAKQKFSELVQRAVEEGPQVVTRHGEGVAVVVSIDEYRRLTGDKPDFAKFLLSAPDWEALDLERAKDKPRDVAV
ncbi:MAG: type II toxin-antitoxin system Phd/YefM family antitoxin [Chloroflexi bacterium]|nr:type II toxin-antitoxin system Phd/YefM family antitoxin [Chloroflexota bacterium]MCL5109486.1 type II toxin-antitoxin system Phd/YefM family antitoxin [Chloroflexota bacterium]